MSKLSDYVGSSGQVQALLYVPRSRTWVAPADGVLDFFAMAGHGSGSVAYGAGFYATGAGAAEIAVKSVPVKAGDSFTITIGAGGNAVTRTGAGSSAGADGADTTISGPGVAITVKGGKGGRVGPTGTALTGGAGGTGGTGGDRHLAGGRGGNVAATAAIGAVTGSGAPNPLGLAAQTATRGGDVSGTAGGVTGGGGVGGRGGDSTGSTSYQTAGGGYGGDAADNFTASATAAGPNALGQFQPASPTAIVPALAEFGLDWFGGGSPGAGTSPGPGGGGSGSSGASAAMSGFGGGGGCNSTNTTASIALPPSLLGPGSSLNANYLNAGYSLTSGAGGSGLVVLKLKKG